MAGPQTGQSSNTVLYPQLGQKNYDQSIYSAVCGSSYEASGKSLLVDYPWADGGKLTRLVGLDAQHQVVFDFQYVNAGGCNTSWNAVPIHLEAMQIQ